MGRNRYYGQSPWTYGPDDPTYYKRVLQDTLAELGVPNLIIRNGFFAGAVKFLFPYVASFHPLFLPRRPLCVCVADVASSVFLLLAA